MLVCSKQTSFSSSTTPPRHCIISFSLPFVRFSLVVSLVSVELYKVILTETCVSRFRYWFTCSQTDITFFLLMWAVVITCEIFVDFLNFYNSDFVFVPIQIPSLVSFVVCVYPGIKSYSTSIYLRIKNWSCLLGFLFLQNLTFLTTVKVPFSSQEVVVILKDELCWFITNLLIRDLNLMS